MKSHGKHIVVIGAGPSGLMAAISAAAAGAKVAVLERQVSICRKLKASGGGRCNLTNTLKASDFPSRFGRQGRFIVPSLKLLDNTALRSYFDSLGVKTCCTDGFHVFPVSQKATNISDALARECRRLGVEILLEKHAISIEQADGAIKAVVLADGTRIPASAVVLASGGKGYPALGGCDSGYAIAARCGHTIIKPVPGLVEIVLSNPWAGNCAGVTLARVSLKTDVPSFRNETVEGALLFTHNGISGPAAIDISGTVSRLIDEKGKVALSLNFFPGLSFADIMQIVEKWRSSEPKRNLLNLLSHHLPRSVTEIVLSQTGVAPSAKVVDLSRDKKESLCRNVLEFRLDASGTAGFDKAMVTRGGIALKEVNPETLESRTLKGFYFTGEVLDLDGPCGGYNLQWAFSSGWLAGKSAAAE